MICHWCQRGVRVVFMGTVNEMLEIEEHPIPSANWHPEPTAPDLPPAQASLLEPLAPSPSIGKDVPQGSLVTQILSGRREQSQERKLVENTAS
jgi:hypothetical protein